MKLGLFLFLAFIIQDGSAQDVDLEHWMTNLPDTLKNVPFIYLAIPGSHNSMTYGITRSSEFGPDAEQYLYNLFYSPLIRTRVMGWKVTQVSDALEQLHMGIRYFDLRLATKKGTDNFYTTHGLYAGEITEPLNQIKSFVDSHPGEIVILDFQHFYDFELEDHQRLVKLLLELFGTRLVPQLTSEYMPEFGTYNLERITLNSLNKLKQQVVIVYRNYPEYMMAQLWQPWMMQTPWPRAVTVSELMDFFTNMWSRQAGVGFVHQAVLTPTLQFVLGSWLSNLRYTCAVPVKNQVLPKLAKDFQPGVPFPQVLGSRAPVNVVIADFIEMDNAVFSRTIIQLNSKLFNNTELIYNERLPTKRR